MKVRYTYIVPIIPIASLIRAPIYTSNYTSIRILSIIKYEKCQFEFPNTDTNFKIFINIYGTEKPPFFKMNSCNDKVSIDGMYLIIKYNYDYFNLFIW